MGRTSLGRCGSYELLVELATGGMATVYLGRAADGRDAPLVAIKRPHRHLAKDKSFLTMLVDEARLASSIEHDNVVKVRELGFEGGEPFIVLDYVEGAALSEVRSELHGLGRAIDARVAVRMALDALAGLEAAHVLHDDEGKHLGIVHRDVSPHNILIGCDGRARVTDFGIAKAVDRVQTTATHEVKGKIAYLAPERVDRRRLCTVQGDVFAMAVVLWECIAGRRLFRGEQPLETLQEVMTGPIPSLRRLGVPIVEPLDGVILKGLSRDLKVRYKTAVEFATALGRASGGPAGVATHAEVSALVEVLFGDRMRVRHEAIREALIEDGAGEGDRLLANSGLPPRNAPTPEVRERELRQLEAVAPPAPSERYAFGETSEPAPRRPILAPRSKKVIAVSAGIALVTGGAVLLQAPDPKPAEPAPATTPLPPPSPSPAKAGTALRHVVVPLPFPATHVMFDEQSRALPTPSEVVAFDIPESSGPLHRVVATSTDGTKAQSFVREHEGVAKVEGEGFVIEEVAPAPPPASGEPASSAPRRVIRRRPVPTAPPSAKPAASVKDGFTKLR